jgi:hypothetical protein
LTLEARASGSYVGYSFVSDESPPSATHYAGLRFQITYIFILFWRPRREWDGCDDYPFARERFLLDIVNNPGKGGSDLLKVLAIQLQVKGLVPHEACSGVGDGGGENVGAASVNALISANNPLYFWRRCFGHLPWRMCDAGIDEMKPHGSSTIAISTYLREGITWTRLKAISVAAISAGGLALFAPQSIGFKKIFGTAPPTIIHMRPETHADFLVWLVPREAVLQRVCEKDFSQRTLQGSHHILAQSTLRSKRDLVMRRIDMVLLKRGLYLYYLAKGQNYIAPDHNFSELIEKATEILSSMDVDSQFCELLQITTDDLEALGANGIHCVTWVQVLVYVTMGIDESDCDAYIAEANEYHAKVCLRMMSHLKLTISNFPVGPWLAAQMLRKDAVQARLGARLFREHLVARTPQARSAYETAFFDDHTLMAQLTVFAEMDPPCLLWKNNAAFADLMIHLGNIFLGGPDHVLDAEGVHACWQWIEHVRRATKLPLLNALLKIQNHLSFFSTLPDIDALRPFIIAASRQRTQLYARIRNEGTVAPGLRTEAMFMNRFNLGPLEVDLLKHDLEGHRDANNAADQTPAVRWANYLRWIFTPGSFFRFTDLAKDRHIYIAENKSFAGRSSISEGEAHGRFLAAAWFEVTSEDLDGPVVAPVEPTEERALKLQLYTVAELSKAAGFFPEVTPSMSARDVEIAHEAAVLSHGLVKLKSARIGDFDTPWSYALSEPEDAEMSYASDNLMKLSRMGLARQLQIRDQFNDEMRNLLSTTLTKETLLQALAHTPVAMASVAKAMAKAGAAPPPPPVGAPIARGRGGVAHGGRAAARGRGGRGVAAVGAPIARGRGKGGRGVGGRGAGGRGRGSG